MPSNEPFVSSTDVPDWMAEKVAQVAHQRACSVFDGGTANRFMPTEPFQGEHRELDMVWASIHVADVCTALGITVAQLSRWPLPVSAHDF